MSHAHSQRVRAHGVTLQLEIDGEGPPVLILHGFTGSSHSMESVAAGLSDSYRTIRLDLVGHGSSDAPIDPGAYTISSCVEQIVSALDLLELRRVHVVGYSMGGRAALTLAVSHPERLRSVVLIGASAGIENPAERASRRREDEGLARSIEREGLEAFVDGWMARPLFATQRRLGPDRLAAARAQRLENRVHGLALSLRGMGTGAQPDLNARLQHVQTPICLVVGEEDAKFCNIAASLERRLPRSRVERIPDAGHAAHLENPDAFRRAVRRFLAENSDEAPRRATMTEPRRERATKGRSSWPA